MAAPGGAGAAPMAMAMPIPAPILLPEPPPFPAWLAARLDALGLDRAVYGAYIEGLLREEESDEERLEALRAVLAACLEEDLLNDVCREVVERWSDSQVVDSKEEKEDEVQAITSMMEKQARIVVKPKEVSQEEKQRKAALLAQYANVTDEEDGGDEQDGMTTAVNIGSEKSLFRNTNVEDVLNARKLERELLRDEFQKKKEQDKLQREKDKLAKQERKEKEKKRTQKGERKR
ncbi:coiled-coil domain-containing protein 43 [Molothrus aeneus]|uniref:coiled-coil domain-containing protein 43 n=1 Tax=Molothrus ater TaxID=84834 RepID=UPI00174A5669|nr:coiled-coil domain-containing protein 43 [Molothrus ater]XP_054505348.1 coiled-coil domain-containing protein 43 [Agelaius phoeniceus]